MNRRLCTLAYSLAILLGVSHKTSAQALPAPLINFDYRIIDGEPMIQKEILDFTAKTNIPISVVFVYRNNPDAYLDLKARWQIDPEKKGILILINSFAEGEFIKHMDIIYKTDIKIDEGDVEDIIKHCMVPLMQGIAWFDFEQDQYNEQVYGISEHINERVIQAVIQCIKRLQKTIKLVKTEPLPAPLKNQDGSFTFITPAGQKIILPAETTNASFYQKITNDDDSRIVAGTLQAFSIGRKRYTGQLSGSTFGGYATKEGSKYVPIIQPNTADVNVIMGLVCSRGFHYTQFSAPAASSKYSQVSKPFTYYTGSSAEVLDELSFPVISYSAEFRFVDDVRSNHEELTKTSLDVVEKQTFDSRYCNSELLLPLLKIAQLKSLYTIQFENFWKPFQVQLSQLTSNTSGAPYIASSPLPRLTKESLLRIADQDLYAAYCLIAHDFMRYLKDRSAPPDLQSQNNFTFITPAGTMVDVPSGASKIKFFTRVRTVADTAIMIGTLMGFTYEGKEYEAAISGTNFVGYKSGKDVYRPKASTSDFVVMGIPYLNPDFTLGMLHYDTENRGDPDRFKLLKIHHHGLPSYTGSSGKIVSERYFPIRPYSTESPVEPESVEIPFGELTTNDLIDFEPGFSKKEKRIIKRYSGTSTIFPALKAAQLEVLNVDIFEQFTKTFDSWTIPITCFPGALWEIDYVCKNQTLNDQWQNDKYLFYTKFINGFREQLHRHDTDVPTFLRKLQTQGLLMNITELTINLKRFQTYHFDNLTVDQRILILRLFTKYEMHGDVENAGAIAKRLNGAEGYALAILQSTPEEQQKRMLDRLSSDRDGVDKNNLLHALSKDYYGIDGDEFTEFVTTLTQWVKKATRNETPLTIMDAIEFKKAIPFKPGFWFASSLTDFFDEEGKIHLETVLESSFLEDETVKYSVVSKPFEYIMVNLKKDYQIGSNTYKKGQIIMLPAFHAYLLFTSENSKRLQTGGEIAINVVIIIFGFPEFAAFRAASLLTRAVAYYEVGLDVSDFVVSFVLVEKLEKSEEGKSFLKHWQLFQHANTLGLNAKDIKDAVTSSYVKLTKSEHMSLLTSGEQKMLEDMMKYGTLASIPNWHHPEYLNLGTKLNSLGTDIKNRFTAKFTPEQFGVFDENLFMVDAWLAADKDPKDLVALADFLKRNPDVNYNFLKREVDLLPTDQFADWMNSLNSTAKYRQLEEKLKTFDPNERINFRKIFSENHQFLKNANDDLLLTDAWKILSVDATLSKSVSDITTISHYLKVHPARGNLLSEEFQLLTNTSEKQQWIESLASIKNYPNVENRIISLQFSPKQRIVFRKEFKASKDLLSQMNENELLVDAWKVIGEDVHIRPRTLPQDMFAHLQTIAEFLAVNASGLGYQGDKLADLIREIQLLPSRPEKFYWLSGIEKLSGYPTLEYFVGRFPDRLRASFRIDFYKKDELLEKFRKSPEMLESWRVLHADPKLRLEEEHLQTVHEFIQKRTRSVSDLELEFKNLPEEARLDWIKSLKSARSPDLPTVDGINTLTRLKDKPSSISFSGPALVGQDLDVPVWPKVGGQAEAHTAKSFLKETGVEIFDIILSGGFYVKFDARIGTILLGNTSGEYYAFAVVADDVLKAFRLRAFSGVSDSEFRHIVAAFMNEQAQKMKILSGLTQRTLTIGGKTELLSADKPNVLLGRFKPDITAIVEAFGNFKSVGLGETPGGIVILNRPDGYWTKGGWWKTYNEPFIDRVITNRYPTYLVTFHQNKADVVDDAGNLVGAYAQELHMLSERNYKPVNASDAQWAEIRGWFGFNSKISAALEVKLKTLSPSMREAFHADFGEYISDFNDDPLQLDAWRVLFADQGLRRGVESRKTIRSYLANNNDQVKLTEEFSMLTSPIQRGDWLNGVKAMTDSKHRAVAYKITRFDAKTRIECRTDLQRASTQTLDALAEDPSLLDVWKNDIKSTDVTVLRQYRDNGSLRQQYITEVGTIRGKTQAMLAAGKTQEEVARFACETRREITIRYKHLTPDDLLEYIFKFNTIRYKNPGFGDEWGQTWEGALKKSNNDYAKIIEGSSRSMGDKKAVGKSLFEAFKNDTAERQKLEPILKKYRMLEL